MKSRKPRARSADRIHHQGIAQLKEKLTVNNTRGTTVRLDFCDLNYENHY